MKLRRNYFILNKMIQAFLSPLFSPSSATQKGMWCEYNSDCFLPKICCDFFIARVCCVHPYLTPKPIEIFYNNDYFLPM